MTKQNGQQDDDINITVYYFSGGKNTLRGRTIDAVGHVAIGFDTEQIPLQERRNYLKQSDKGYLSYGSIEVTAENKNESFLLKDNKKSFDGDKQHYGEKNLIAINLKIPRSNLLKASEGFGMLDRNKYKLNTQNCAHAVYAFLQTMDIGITKINQTSLLPSTVAGLAINKLIADNNKNKEEIISNLKDLVNVVYDDKAPVISSLDLIRDLISTDIKRLEHETVLNKIKLSFDGQEKKDAKIVELKTLLNTLQSDPNNSELHFHQIAKLAATIGGETEKNLKQCITCFPYQELPLLEEKRKFLMDLKDNVKIASTQSSFFNSNPDTVLPKGLKDFKDYIKHIDKDSSPLIIHQAFEDIQARLSKKLEKETPHEFYSGLQTEIHGISPPEKYVPAAAVTLNSIKEHELELKTEIAPEPTRPRSGFSAG